MKVSECAPQSKKIRYNTLLKKLIFYSKATALTPRGTSPMLPTFSESTPLHFVADIGENAFCCLEVVGNPAPRIDWFKVGQIALIYVMQF